MLSLLAGLSLALAADVSIPLHAHVTDATGGAIDTTVTVQVRLFPSASAPTAVYTESFTGIDVPVGNLSVMLGAAGGLDSGLFADPLWAEITVAGSTLEPRMPLGAVPYAARAMESAIRHDTLTFANYSENSSVLANWTDTGHQIALPEPGTYMVTYTAETFRGSGSRPDLSRMRLWSPTVASDINPNGLFRAISGTNGQSSQSHASTSIQVVLTVTAPETVKIQVRDEYGGSIQLFSATMTYLRLD